MARICVVESVSLDGVMQGLGSPDEDTRGGFTRGGWGRPYSDEVAMEEAGKGMADTTAILFGRLTYLKMAAFWPHQTDGNPFTAMLDRTPKYVVSKTLAEPLEWQNSFRLDGIDDVARLKDELEGNIVVLGSGELVRALTLERLVDQYSLSIHPIVLGGGTRLFPDQGVFDEFRLVSSVPTSTGVIIATYERRSE